MRTYGPIKRFSVVIIAIAGVVLGAAVTQDSRSEAEASAFKAFPRGQAVPLVGKHSSRTQRAYLLGTANGHAFYRVDVRGLQHCFGIGDSSLIGSLGNVACGFSDFPTDGTRVIYDAVVGADGPSRALNASDMRLYRLNVFAAEGVAEITVAGERFPISDNIASISFDTPKPLGVVTAQEATGKVVDRYDLRPQD